MTPERKMELVEKAEQVIRDVHEELPEVWLGGRQRYVLVEAIEKALLTIEREVWERLQEYLDELGEAYFQDGNTQGRLVVEQIEKWCRSQGEGI